MAGDTLHGSLSQDEAIERFAALVGEDPETEDTEDDAEDADAEDEGEEPEDKAGEDEADDDEDAEGDEPQGQEQLFTVKVAGEELQVPLTELLNGYSRQADYTRKSMAVAEARRELETRAAAIEGERAQMIQFLEGQVQLMQQQQPAQPDWERLRREDPIEYAAQWAEFQQRQQQQYALQQRLQSERAKAQEAEQRQLQQTLATEAERLVEAVPEWRDEQVAAREKAEMAEFARGLGFSEQELSSIYDHRTVLVLRKAYLYDRAQQQKPRLQAEAQQRRVAPKVAPAGGAVRKEIAPVQKSIKRLAQTGSVKDAAAVFARIL